MERISLLKQELRKKKKNRTEHNDWAAQEMKLITLLSESIQFNRRKKTERHKLKLFSKQFPHFYSSITSHFSRHLLKFEVFKTLRSQMCIKSVRIASIYNAVTWVEWVTLPPELN